MTNPCKKLKKEHTERRRFLEKKLSRYKTLSIGLVRIMNSRPPAHEPGAELTEPTGLPFAKEEEGNAKIWYRKKS